MRDYHKMLPVYGIICDAVLCARDCVLALYNIVLYTYKRWYKRSYTVTDLKKACVTGDVATVEKALEHSTKYADLALSIAVVNNQRDVAKFILENYHTEYTDLYLEYACAKNFYDMAELLVKNGANPLAGLRVSKSPNITRMLYRYEQGTENIS